MTEKAITLRFTLGFAEYRRVLFLRMLHQFWWFLALGVFGLIMILMTPLMAGWSKSVAADPHIFAKSLIWPLGIIVGIPALAWWSISSQWSKTPALREERTYQIGEEGIELEMKSTSSRIAWNLITEARIQGSDLLIFLAKNSFHHIPGRVFTDPATRSELLDIIRTHVKKRNF